MSVAFSDPAAPRPRRPAPSPSREQRMASRISRAPISGPPISQGDERGPIECHDVRSQEVCAIETPGGVFLEPRTGEPAGTTSRATSCMLRRGFRRSCRATPCSSSRRKTYLVMVHEFQRMTRIIPLDGRPHRKGLEPMLVEVSTRSGGASRARELDLALARIRLHAEPRREVAGRGTSRPLAPAPAGRPASSRRRRRAGGPRSPRSSARRSAVCCSRSHSRPGCGRGHQVDDGHDYAEQRGRRRRPAVEGPPPATG